jgi:hypothetical protein
MTHRAVIETEHTARVARKYMADTSPEKHTRALCRMKQKYTRPSKRPQLEKVFRNLGQAELCANRDAIVKNGDAGLYRRPLKLPPPATDRCSPDKKSPLSLW